MKTKKKKAKIYTIPQLPKHFPTKYLSFSPQFQFKSKSQSFQFSGKRRTKPEKRKQQTLNKFDKWSHCSFLFFQLYAMSCIHSWLLLFVVIFFSFYTFHIPSFLSFSMVLWVGCAMLLTEWDISCSFFQSLLFCISNKTNRNIKTKRLMNNSRKKRASEAICYSKFIFPFLIKHR